MLAARICIAFPPLIISAEAAEKCELGGSGVPGLLHRPGSRWGGYRR
jgi:hypothetical protein